MTDKYAVIGNPVAHSRSPEIHAAFARQSGDDIDYVRLLAPLDGFRDCVERFRSARGKGANVTLPFKLEACRLATRLSDRAEQAKAANTLSFADDAICADNTDGVGLTRDIEQNLGCAIARRRVLLMGAGGAARGVLQPLLARQPQRIVIANRTRERAASLAQQFARYANLEAAEYSRLAGMEFDIVINATSASVSGDVPPLPESVFAPGSLAYDMMYGPAAMPFLRFARAGGAARIADGLGMLVEQAAESFFIWRGKRPETAPVIAALRNQDSGVRIQDSEPKHDLE